MKRLGCGGCSEKSGCGWEAYGIGPHLNRGDGPLSGREADESARLRRRTEGGAL